MLRGTLYCAIAAASATLALAGAQPTASVDASCSLFKRKSLTDVELKGIDGKSRGEIDGLLIDAADGSVRYALVGAGGVLGIGETERIIPWEAIRATADAEGEKCLAETELTQEQIDAAPTFRKEVVVDTKLERAVRKNARLSEEPPAGFAKELILASDLEDAVVRSEDGKDLGKTSVVVIAAHTARVAYVVLESDGVLGLGAREYALPWGTLEVMTNKQNKTELRTSLTKERLQESPEYDKKDWKRMSSTTWNEELCKHHGVPFFCNARRSSG